MVLIHKWVPVAWLDDNGLCVRVGSYAGKITSGVWKMFSIRRRKHIYIDFESWQRVSHYRRAE
jgi:hypothetical protein